MKERRSLSPTRDLEFVQRGDGAPFSGLVAFPNTIDFMQVLSWVWSERLKRAGVDLANPLLARRTIAAIAYDWGFSDPAHFSRAFKAAYKMSPRAFRQTRGTTAIATEA